MLTLLCNDITSNKVEKGKAKPSNVQYNVECSSFRRL